MPQETIVSTLPGETCVEKLAQLFPQATSLGIPVRVVTQSKGRRRLQERTVLQFGTAYEVMFSSILPLEFEDRIRVISSGCSLDTWLTVVAVRYHEGNKAVAARFDGTIKNWIIKP
jgi:hypothetical protein